MSRPCRFQAENCFYHITSRGDDRKAIFTNDSDYLKFLEYIETAKERFKFYVYAYCLMGNHYHLFIETTQPNLSRIMQYINTSYTVYYNTKYKRCGHLFQGRFKSIIVEAETYFAELTRYIHLNPVRAKIVDSPEKYPWSSYTAYLFNKPESIIDKERIKELAIIDISKYRQFVLEKLENCPDPFKNVYAGFMLGRVEFIKDKLKQLKDDVESKDFAHKRAVKNIIEPEAIIEAVSDYFKISPSDLCQLKTRPGTVKYAAIYLVRRRTGLTNAQIGALFNMKHSAVSTVFLGFEKRMKEDKKLKAAVDKIDWKLEV